MRKLGNVISKLIMVVALAVFVFAAYNLYQIYSEYKEASNSYKEVAGDAGMNDVEIGEDAAEELTLEDIGKVDFEALKATNPDVIGWIRFPNPNTINYPIVKSKDNNEYLHRTFDGKGNSSGSIFVDKNNASDFSDYNTLVYGHNMKDKSMFANLMMYKDEAFFKANPYFYIYTDSGKAYRMKICSVMKTTDESDAYRMDFADENDFKAYAQKMLSQSIYSTGVNVDEIDRIVTLSTCTNVADNERWIVQGIFVNTVYGE